MVGLKGRTDESGRIAQHRGVLAGEAESLGYGHGCMVAIDRLKASGAEVEAYIFVSGNGADRPSDIVKLIEEFEGGGLDVVIGNRRLRPSNWRYHRSRRAFPNVTLAMVTILLTGRLFLISGHSGSSAGICSRESHRGS